MKSLLSIFCLFLSLNVITAQDTITVQTFTWDSTSRRGLFQFPDDPTQSYRKIIMQYNMRCHGARVGVGSVGCYEWDYSCNTFITDSTKQDSSLATIGNYVISGFNGLQFYYTTIPTYTYYKSFQKNVSFGGIVSEQKFTIGNGNLALPISSNDGLYRAQYLITASELLTSGMKAGKITGLDLFVVAAGNKLNNFRIRLKHTKSTSLANPDNESLSEVYFKNTDFNSTGLQHFQFYNAFNWDGTSSILVDLSYTNFEALSAPQFMAHDLGSNQQAIYADKVERSLVWDGLNSKIDGGKLSAVSNEISVAFWLYGATPILPNNNSVLEGVNANNQRSFNIHLPWSNGSIYFDCGFKNGGYDRIEKAAAVSDYEGQWNHWAFTKNAVTGEMKIYKNGSLWLVGLAKLNSIQMSSLTIGDASNNGIPYNGRMRELSIWNKALDSIQINQWKNRTIDPSHPDYANLIFYYPLQELSGSQLTDVATNPQHASLPLSLNRNPERGHQLLMNFNTSSMRPNLRFVQGVYTTQLVTDIPVLDSIPNGPRTVRQYKVVNNNLILDSTFYLYAAGEDKIYLESGEASETTFIDPEDLIDIQNLKYYLRTPGKFELLSLVTPYGNNLDLGKEGKTFQFDVTDFTPVLKGKRLLSMELGGENQEEIDIKFLFIKGMPERNVLDISNVWPFQRGYFSEILSNKRFEARKLRLHPTAKNFKLRFSITGHEQNGEFTPRAHFVSVNGTSNKKFPFTVWKECGFNPIYPQGGTWIFDRAGWCPGAPTEAFHFDISNLVTSGQEINVDYGLEPPQLDQANYLVSSQLVAYGPLNHKLDASLEEIVRPVSNRVEFDRLNPSCNLPTVSIRNSGSDEIRSIKIEYGIKNRIKEIYTWTGILNSLTEQRIELPVVQSDFWNPGPDSIFLFEASILEVNGQSDEDASNNLKRVPFKPVDRYNGSIIFEFKTNNIPQDNAYKIVNSQGQIVIERSGMAPVTTYRDELLLPPGCYTLYVSDLSNDGLNFWYFPTYGTGSARIMRKVNNTVIPIKSFNPDFGGAFQYDFVLNGPVKTNETEFSGMFSISPNPSHGAIDIYVQSLQLNPIQLSIRNLEGKLLVTENFIPTQSGQAFNWPLKNLESGTYFVQIVQNNRLITRKLVVL